LLASAGFCIWAVFAVLTLCINIAVVAAIIAGVYWCFTGEWIGNAPFLN